MAAHSNGGKHIPRDFDPVTGSSSSTMSAPGDMSLVRIRIYFPDADFRDVVTFGAEETVWSAKQKVLQTVGKEGLADGLNFGLYLPESNGRHGKFLDEERQLKEYSLPGPIAQLEFRYKKREVKASTVTPGKLKKINSPQNQKQLLECVTKGDVDGISKLTFKGVDPNFNTVGKGETPLTAAALLQRPRQVMMALVSGGSFLDFRNREGQTAMHVAAKGGNRESIRTLLDLGASPNYKDLQGLTPLYYSVIFSANAQCAYMLLHDRAEVGTRDQDGWTEVHQACKLGLVQHLEHLMFYGAEVNCQSKCGDTPLHICALYNRDECARTLMYRGADKSLKNVASQDAYQVAQASGHSELAIILQQFQSNEVVLYNELPKYNDKRRGTISLATIRNLQRSRSNPQLQMLFSQGDASNLVISTLSAATGHQLVSNGIVVGPGAANIPGTVSGYAPATRTRATVVGSFGEKVTKTVVIHREQGSFGFILRGSKVNSGLSFVPTPEIPALQYFENISPGGGADKAGLKSGDYLLEINGENVAIATHEHCVELMKRAGSRLELKVATMASNTAEERRSPAPSMRSQTSSVVNGLEELEKLNDILNHETEQQFVDWSQTSNAHADFPPPAPESVVLIDRRNIPNAKVLPDSNGGERVSLNRPVILPAPDYNTSPVKGSEYEPAPDYENDGGRIEMIPTKSTPSVNSNFDVGYQRNSSMMPMNIEANVGYNFDYQRTPAITSTKIDTNVENRRHSTTVPPKIENVKVTKQVIAPPTPPTFSTITPSPPPPPPPPPPAPPMPASFSFVPPSDSLGSKNNVPSPLPSSGIPLQVQKQLEERKQRDESHAALLAAVQRRRNLLNTVDNDQIASAIETQVTRKANKQVLYKSGPLAATVQINPTPVPGAVLLAPERPSSTSAIPNNEGSMPGVVQKDDGFAAEAERIRKEYLSRIAAPDPVISVSAKTNTLPATPVPQNTVLPPPPLFNSSSAQSYQINAPPPSQFNTSPAQSSRASFLTIPPPPSQFSSPVAQSSQTSVITAPPPPPFSSPVVSPLPKFGGLSSPVQPKVNAWRAPPPPQVSTLPAPPPPQFSKSPLSPTPQFASQTPLSSVEKPAFSTTQKSSPASEPPARLGKFSMNSVIGAVPTSVRVSSGASTISNGDGLAATAMKPDDTAIPYIPPPSEFASGPPPGMATPVAATLRSISKPAHANSMVFRAAAAKTSTAETTAGDDGASTWPAKPYSERNIETWSTEEVGEWLESLDFGNFRPVFAQHGVTGKMLAGLREPDYEKLGLTLQIQRMKFEREVRKASKVN